MKAALILVTVSWDPTTFPFQIAEKPKDLSSLIIASAEVHDASTKWSWQPRISAIIHHFSRTLEESVSQDQILKNGLCLWTKHTPQLGLWSTYRHQFFKELLENGQSMQWRPWRSRPHRCLWRAHPKQPKQDLKSWMKQRLMQLELSNISNLTWSRNRKVPRNWDLHCRPGFTHLIGSEPKTAPLQFSAATALSACKADIQISILQRQKLLLHHIWPLILISTFTVTWMQMHCNCLRASSSINSQRTDSPKRDVARESKNFSDIALPFLQHSEGVLHVEEIPLFN